MPSDGYEKFRLIMWKNWKMTIRNPVLMIVDILVPVMFSCLLIITRFLGPMEHKKDVTHYPPVDPSVSPSQSRERYVRADGGSGIAWAPVSGATATFTQQCAAIMDQVFTPQFRVEKREDPEDLERYLESPGVTDMASGRKILCGVVFDGKGDGGMCSPDLRVIIRFPGDLRTVHKFTPDVSWHSKKWMPVLVTGAPRDPDFPYGPVPPYYDEGFTSVQTGISKGVLGFCQKTRGDPEFPPGFQTKYEPKVLAPFLNPAVKLQRYSATAYDLDPLLESTRFMVPFLIMLSFIYTCLSITKVVTNEKETQMKELMKIMGLQSSLHWLGWFVRCMALLLISVALIVVILKVEWMEGNAVFNLTDASVLFVFYLYYMVALCAFCFMISAFFTQSHLASVVAGLVWFLFYCPHFFTVSSTTAYPISTKIPLSIFLNVDMAFTVELLLVSETTGKGVKWKNICLPAMYSEKITVCHLLMMMLLDAVIYMLVCLYVEAVCPGKYGVPEPYYFFLTSEHWLSRQECLKSASPPIQPPTSIHEVDPNNFEEDPELEAGVEIKHLWKIFGNKISVSDLNLNMYEGQITVLLGHNGAGKTTTMSMLTGIYTPTMGTATIAGCDIVTNIEGARRSLGLCPQYNVLFDELTVREHLYFFCKLKGMEDKDLDKEITRFIVMLQLEDKEHAKSRTLSGGMKRKLNAGVALCAHSKVVFLDEPTSGMDPAARRTVWDVLLLEKEGRTLLLTTHFMDEADVLGDRIAIMAAGQLECCGSSFFLKNKFGSGYRLIIEKGPKCDSDKVSAVLRKYIPGTEPSQEIGSELNYQLKREDVNKFEPMLKDLESHTEDLYIESYGLSLTTLEEVFISMGKDKESAANIRKAGAIRLKKGPELITGWKLQNYRIQAEFRKKWWVWTRNWPVFMLHCLFPIIFLTITMLVRFADDVDLSQCQMPIDLSACDKRGVITVVSSTAEGDDSPAAAGTRLLNALYKHAAESEQGNVEDLGFKPNPDKALEDYILTKMAEDNMNFRAKYLVSVSWTMDSPPSALAQFSDLPYHACPLTLSLVFNAALDAYQSKMRVVSYPLEVSQNTKAIVKAAWSQTARVAPILAFAMAFCAAYYIQFVVRERVVKNKHLQLVSGVDIWVFWLVHYTFDGLTFTLPCLTAVLTLACFQEKGLATFEELGRVYLILIVFGWGVIPIMYCASFLFDIPATAYTRMAMFNIFTDVDPKNEDSDVKAEKKMIRDSDIESLSKENALVLRDVTKYYGSFLAVNHTCVTVKKGQCFGLLGTNGAGKTTTFKMMTGDIKMSKGEIYIDGLNSIKHKKQVQQRIGYCPQFDAILGELTGWETMQLFCLFRGIPKTNIKEVSMEKADHLLITKHMAKKTGKYSGGNKRKLSTAVALIGNPAVVFLDEPTTGMDPMARRHLWNVICGVRDSGISVVLTSHSMEECEALCTRLAIQVNGNFKCLGSLQHLKGKYAKGFSLQIKVTLPPQKGEQTRRRSLTDVEKVLEPVKQFIISNFKGAKLESEYMGIVSYTIASGDKTWSQIFGMMEKAKPKLKIEDYAIGQSSLETVFFNFTKEQLEDKRAK